VLAGTIVAVYSYLTERHIVSASGADDVARLAGERLRAIAGNSGTCPLLARRETCSKKCGHLSVSLAKCSVGGGLLRHKRDSLCPLLSKLSVPYVPVVATKSRVNARTPAMASSVESLLLQYAPTRCALSAKLRLLQATVQL